MPFLLLMVQYLVPYVASSFRSGDASTNSGGLIFWSAKAIRLAGFIVFTLLGVSEIIQKTAIIRGLIESHHPFDNAKKPVEFEAQALLEVVRS